MKRMLSIVAAGLATACVADGPYETEDAQASLAQELQGRVAGAPVSCVNMRDLRGNRSAGEMAIIFEGPGDTIYVNRPASGCPSLKWGRALRTTTPTGQLCRGDIVTVFDPTTGVEYGSCGLGDFTPYRRTG